MFKILFTGNTLSDSDIQNLGSRGFQIISGRTDYLENELVTALEGVHGYVLGGDEIATGQVIEAAPDLKVIAFLGTGYERFVDVRTASSCGIAVTNTPGANAYTVAEFTVGLVLDLLKRLTYLNNRTKMGGWEKHEAWNLRGRTLGIVGMGTIGALVARILRNGFGMNVTYVSRTSKPDVEAELGARKVGLQDLLQHSDVVSLHASYTQQTIGMLGKAQFQMMRTEAILVNTARAELVDPVALYEALRDGKISAAAFDGYYVEPIPAPMNDKYGLLSLGDDRFIITPHTAYNSLDANRKMERMAVESVIAVLEGKEPETIVNPDYRVRRNLLSPE